MSTAQQLGLIGNSIKVQSLPTASAETFGAGNRYYTLIGQQEGYITGHTYHTIVANDVYSWEDVACGNYNMLDNIPVINQDLTASDFTPVANTYYRHTGATTATFTQGVIYCYDGTEYKALDGSGGGGISDVKVDGTSVVTDGVANIPAASSSKSGVVTTGAQTISGTKDFYGILARAFTYKGQYMNFELSTNDSTGTYGGLCVQAANSKAESISYYFYDDRRKNNYIILRPTDEGPDAICLYIKSKSYRAMVSPTTWSSGTSGSVTLTESGTYQIYMNDGKNNINFGLVYFDASTDTYAQTPMINHTEGFMLSIEGSAGDNPKTLHIYQIDNVGHTQTEVNYTVYYRRVGI